ncbi:MAG: VWA domain-containing protein [Acidimicrobiia bacterium]|nr:VWA domain-containing protein [Acidimicrobiia bacterium]
MAGTKRAQRGRNFRRIVVALVIGLACAAVVPAGHAAETPPCVTPAGRGRLVELDVVAPLDDSVSAPENDPEAVRYQAAEVLRGFLESVSTCGLDHRLAFVHYGTSAPAELATPLVPVSDPGGVLAASLVPLQLGYTNFVPALERVAEILNGAEEDGRQRIVVFYTDGLPDDGSGRPLAEQFADIAAALGRLGQVRVHLLARIADDAAWASVEPYWSELGLASVQRLGSVDELGARYLGILRSELGLGRGDEAELVRRGDEMRIELPPYLEGLTVTALAAESGAELEIVGPDGAVDPDMQTESGRAQVLGVRDPEAGEWRVRLVSGGPVAVALDRVPLVARLVSPPATAPQGRPLRIEATFLTSDGRALPAIDDKPRFQGATVVRPDGSSARVELEEIDAGRFRATETVPTPVPGRYEVTLTLRGATEAAAAETTVPVDVVAVPYLESMAPRRWVTAGQPVVAEADLLLGGEPVEPAAAFAEDPRGVAVARLFSDGALLETRSMQPFEHAGFRVEFHTRAQPGTSYEVETELGGLLVDGTAVAETWRGDPFDVRRTLWQQIERALAWTGLALAVGIVLLLLAATIAFFRLERVHRRVDLETGPVFMAGRRLRRVRVTTGGDGRLWIWQGSDGIVRTTRRLLPIPIGATAHPRARVK